MAFSSRRGGWAHSLLPSSNSKSKLPRKARKRTFLKDFFLANFFTIGLSLSLIFLLFITFRYGVPKPLAFKSSNSRLPKLRKQGPRKPISQEVAGSGAAVDITTKDLYDKIEFLDKDGGPWKQGWVVNYKGNEWDSEKLKIFVVPHSHNDPGWKLTVEEYYDRQSRHILDTIVETLSKVGLRYNFLILQFLCLCWVVLKLIEQMMCCRSLTSFPETSLVKWWLWLFFPLWFGVYDVFVTEFLLAFTFLSMICFS